MYLSLQSQGLKDVELAKIAEIKQFREINMLNLRFNEITTQGIASISSTKFHSLNALCLSNNEITDESMRVLVKGKYRIKKLDLSNYHHMLDDNKITSTGVYYLVTAYPNLEVIDLGKNSIGDKGFTFLTDLDHVRSVFVSKCKITSKGISQIFSHVFKKLTKLNLSKLISYLRQQ